MATTIEEKSDKISQLQSEIDFIESASSVKRKGKAEEQVYGLEKQIFKLKREAEAQNNRRVELETRTEVTEKRVVELSSNLENLLKVNVEEKQRTEFSLKSFADSSYKKFTEKWVPNIKDVLSTCAIYLALNIRSLTQNSIKVYRMCKQALTRYLVQALDTVYNYGQEEEQGKEESSHGGRSYRAPEGRRESRREEA